MLMLVLVRDGVSVKYLNSSGAPTADMGSIRRFLVFSGLGEKTASGETMGWSLED